MSASQIIWTVDSESDEDYHDDDEKYTGGIICALLFREE
jgi:hypothetical protein